MKAVLFPFTYLSDSLALALASCFDTTAVYQPVGGQIPQELAGLASRGLIDLKVPYADDDAELIGILSNFKAWARLHQGHDLQQFFQSAPAVPYFDADSTFQIHAQLKTKPASAAAEDEDPDHHALPARAFLQIAQEFDRISFETAQRLDQVESLEKEIFDHLDGRVETEGPALTVSMARHYGQSLAHMGRKRMTAWRQLYHRQPVDSPLLVTIGQSLLEHLVTDINLLQPVLSIDRLPTAWTTDDHWRTWRSQLAAHLHHLASGAPPEDAEAPLPPSAADPDNGWMQLTVFRCPGHSLQQCLDQLFGPACAAESTNGSVAETKATLLGVLEFGG